MLKKIFPFLGWRFAKGDLRADLMAGLNVALVVIPQSMAVAQLAGLPVVVGLYASILPVLFGALWGSSNHLQTGPVAITSLLTATALMPLAVPETTEYVLLAGMLAVLLGIIRLLIGFFKLTVVANFISKPVMDGFVHAGVLVIASSQVSKLFGLTLQRSDWYLRDLWNLVLNLKEANGIALLLGGLSIALLIVVKKIFCKLPAALFVVAITTAMVYFFQWSERVDIVGTIPTGLPKFTPVSLDWNTVLKLLPGALVITFIGFMEMCGVAKAVAVKSRQPLDLNQEMIGQGMAAISSGFTGGYPVSGSFSRTALSFACGARTGMTSVFTGLFVALFLMFLAGTLYYLPKAALGAIIIVAVVKLLDFRRLFSYWKVSKVEGATALITFTATLLFAPQLQNGILVGVLLSIVVFLFQTLKPHVALLGRHPDGSYRTHDRYNLKLDKHMPVIRFDGRLFFANISYFEEIILDTCVRYPDAKFILVDCQGMNAIDASGIVMLEDMTEKLRENGMELYFARMKYPVRRKLEKAGLFEIIGEDHFYHRIDDAREAALARRAGGTNYTI
ncbi:SulP family inorganic anion transporter [Pontiellaceae bacterium B12227]|nr:SulP family inorganic anion transporter [Pontiellaceae bacterium B12227]